MKVSEYIFSSDIFLGSKIAGGTGGARRKAELVATPGVVTLGVNFSHL